MGEDGRIDSSLLIAWSEVNIVTVAIYDDIFSFNTSRRYSLDTLSAYVSCGVFVFYGQMLIVSLLHPFIFDMLSRVLWCLLRWRILNWGYSSYGIRTALPTCCGHSPTCLEKLTQFPIFLILKLRTNIFIIKLYLKTHNLHFKDIQASNSQKKNIFTENTLFNATHFCSYNSPR